MLGLIAVVDAPIEASPAQTEDAASTATTAPATERPPFHVPARRGTIEIDGDVSDRGWKDAARVTDFSEYFPNERGQPPVRSEAWITYDESHLYVALIARDDSADIRASLRDRDEIWSDDYFGILLDTYGDASWAYYIFANPLGIQGDSRFSSTGGEDDGFDIIYGSEARITGTGYTIEMAIPFASLRFPDRPVQTWRAAFWRTRPRANRAIYTWPPLDRDDSCLLCQFGILTGIEGVKPGGALEILPSVVASQAASLRDPSNPGSGIRQGSLKGEASVGLRYAFAAGLTAEATWNPDFSQVESDVAQVDVNTTFALFFPERRPFFQEGGDILNSPFDMVYTRQINDPLAAAKLVGRIGRTSFAYVGARDMRSPLILPFEERSFVGQGGRSISNIARVRRTFARDSYLGALITDRRMEDGDGSGTAFGVDGALRFLDNYVFEFQLLSSHTREPSELGPTAPMEGLTFDRGAHTAAFDGESFWGHAGHLSVERHSRGYSFDLDYWTSSPTFRSDLGFEFRNDFHSLSLWQGYDFWPAGDLVNVVSPYLYLERRWNHHEIRKHESLESGVSLDLTAQTYVSLFFDLGAERFGGIDFDLDARGISVSSAFSGPVQLSGSYSTGRTIARNTDPPRSGDQTSVGLSATLEPIQRLVIEPSFTYSELTDAETGQRVFSGSILRTRTSLQFTRELFIRLVIQYNDFSRDLSVEPMLTYRINPFTLFYVGATSGYHDFDEPDRLIQTSRQIFAKFQYLFRD